MNYVTGKTIKALREKRKMTQKELAYVTSGSFEVVKPYPEQEISVRFRKKGHGMLYAYCNRHGMVGKRI